MAMTVSTWSGTYYTEVGLSLDRYPRPVGAPIPLAPRVRYEEFPGEVTGTPMVVLTCKTGVPQDHETVIKISGPNAESIRELLTAMLAGLPEPPVFTDDVVLTHIGGSERFLPTHTVIAPTSPGLSYEAGKGWH